jgi:hypothetical protein
MTLLLVHVVRRMQLYNPIWRYFRWKNYFLKTKGASEIGQKESFNNYVALYSLANSLNVYPKKEIAVKHFASRSESNKVIRNLKEPREI